jgi:hypothetical protein
MDWEINGRTSISFVVKSKKIKDVVVLSRKAALFFHVSEHSNIGQPFTRGGAKHDRSEI